MKPLPVSVAWTVLLAAVLPGQDLPPWVLVLARVKEHGRATFEHIPDYACQQTVSRSERPLDSRSFTPVITPAFDSRALIPCITFSATPINLFVHDAGRITVPPGTDFHDGGMLRFDFEVSALAGAYRVQSGENKAVVGVRGRLWVDAKSLDLLRIEEHAVGLPADLNTSDIVKTITYGRARVGPSDVLLPHSSELIVTDDTGSQRRDLVELSDCRESAGSPQPGQDLSPSARLARVKEHGRASFEHIPNSVCRETVKRFEKPRNAPVFQPAGTESLEMASGGGQDTLSLAVTRRLCDRELVIVASNGFPAAGVSNSLACNVFVYNNAQVEWSGEEPMQGRQALRYDFEMPAELSGFEVKAGGAEAAADVRGTFWVDAESLDLLRIEEHASGFPRRLNIRDIAIAITYGRTRVGSLEALLPQSADTVISDSRGGQKKSTLEFTACRESGSER